MNKKEHTKNKVPDMDKLNKIINFIENKIILDKNSPFINYNISPINDPEDLFEGEINLINNGTITIDKRHQIHRKTMDKIVEFSIENNCYDILNKIFIVM